MDDQELIKQVAEKVMGWEVAKSFGEWRYEKLNVPATSFPLNQWLPLTNANHRDMVVERMRMLGWEIIIVSNQGEWLCRFSKDDDGAGNTNKILGCAICKAALKALEETT